MISTTTYAYDVQVTGTYGSQGNRLMKQETQDSSSTVTSRRWYVYDIAGRVTLVMRKAPSGSTVYATQICYDTKGNIWLAVSEQWQVDGSNHVVSNSWSVQAAMEYRYDSARGRYMVRPRGASDLWPAHTYDGSWYDYDGDAIWNDYTVSMSGSTPSVTNVMSHVPGMAMHNSSGTSYLFGNLVGTTERIMTDGDVTHTAVFTASGEPIYENGSSDTRYGYCGAWGYQESSVSGDPLADLGWLHVGARYYDPSSGRFVQRDPIGIRGGLNSYVYAGSDPVRRIDPSGLSWLSDFGQGCIDMGGIAAAAGTGIAAVSAASAVPTLGASSPGVVIGGGIAGTGAITIGIGIAAQKIDQALQSGEDQPGPPEAKPLSQDDIDYLRDHDCGFQMIDDYRHGTLK